MARSVTLIHRRYPLDVAERMAREVFWDLPPEWPRGDRMPVHSMIWFLARAQREYAGRLLKLTTAAERMF